MIEKLQNEVKITTNTLEKHYDMSYEDMYECYLSNSVLKDYHIDIGYVVGLKKAILLMEENK